MKFSRLTKISILLAGFFFLDKVLAFIRQILIARQFGLSPDLDAFNVANNVPDLLFALISGGALAIAFIPVLSEVLTKSGQRPAWVLFSRVANLAFLVTAGLAVVVALFAGSLVRAEFGIAPGFTAEQQHLVIRLMRMNLAATLIFSISGLVMAGLQANQHFLLPAMAPLFYNIGQIIGVTIFSPSEGYRLGGVTLPALGLGVEGLVYGVILGALLHLLIQLPGLLRYHFKWSPSLGLADAEVKKVLRLMGPRLVTVFFIQLIFLIRDNLASRLAAGAVTSLTYGWMIQQVPETLIGTAIGTALLPTLSEHFTRGEGQAFSDTINKAVKVLFAITMPIAAAFAFGSRPLLGLAFDFGAAGTNLLAWVTAAFMLGLFGHSLKEITARSFYASQNAITPLATAGGNVLLYALIGFLLYRPLGAPGIALTDSIVFTLEAIVLLVLLMRSGRVKITFGSSLARGFAAAATSAIITILGVQFLEPRVHVLLSGTLPMLLGFGVGLLWVLPEVKTLAKL
jgi:putative peptidoglycan lipid II flippase